VVVQPKGLPKVALSDWILPAWADPQATTGPFNHNNTLRTPMTVDKGGYLITMTNGVIDSVMGSEITDYTTKNMCRRGVVRLAQTATNTQPQTQPEAQPQTQPSS